MIHSRQRRAILWTLGFCLQAITAAPPSVPENVRGAWLTQIGDVPLPFVQWQAVPDATSYNLYRADDTNTAWALVLTNLTVPFAADPTFSLLPAYYSVTAINAEGESPGSPATTVTEQDCGLLSLTPVEVGSYNTLSATNARINWATSWTAGDEGLVEWRLLNSGETNFPFFLLNTNYQGYHNIELTNLAPASTYQYRLTSISTTRGGIRALGQFTTPQINRAPVPSYVVLSESQPWDPHIYLQLTAVDEDALYSSPPQTNGFRITSQPTNGTLSGPQQNWPWETQASLSYLPNPTARGLDWFEFIATDGFLDSPPLLVVISNWMNQAPIPSPMLLHTPENTPIALTLDVTDPEGDPLTFNVDGIYGGTVSGTAPVLLFTPANDFFGTASISYIVNDGHANGYGSAAIRVGVNSLPQPVDLRRRIYITDGIVRLWWGEVSGAQHYNVYRASETNGPFTLLASGVAATNFNDGTAEYQHTYWYRVRIWDGTAEGEPSAAVLARRDDTGVITLNQQLWQIRGTTGQVQFCSSLIAGVEGLWEFGTTTNYDRVLENTNLLGCQYFSLSNLTPQTIYHYRLTATDGNGNAVQYSSNFATQAPPIANAQSDSTPEDTALNVTLAGSDPNYAGYSLTYSVVSGVAQGTLTATGPNTYRYQPATNYNGADSFTFKVNNGELDSAPATVSLNVTAVNDLPVAANLSVTTGEDTTRVIAPAFTDLDGGPTVIVTMVTPPTHGLAGVSGTNLMYLPATNYFGPDSFTYRVSDGYGFGNTATVSLTVTNRPDAPVGNAQSLTTAEDAALPLTLSGSDADGDALTFVIHAAPNFGTLAGLPPNVTYRPPTNFSGTAQFTFRALDATASSAPTTINITVTAVNDRPVANPQSVSAAEDTARVITLSGTDVEGSTLGYTIATVPTHGTITGSGQSRTYTPAADYNGPDSFTFFVNDGNTNSATATVSITVTSVNDAPLANALAVILNEDTVTNLLLSASDVDGGALTYTVLAPPMNGALTGAAPNLTYTPNFNFNGGDSFEFSVSDGVLSATNVVSLTVSPVNDAPLASPQAITLPEDTSTIVVWSGTDVDGNLLTYAVLSAPTNGTLTGTASNLAYTPDANFNGRDVIFFSVTDGTLSSTSVVSLTVSPVNDAPVASAASLVSAEDSALPITLTGSDAEGDALTFSVMTPPAHGTLSGIAPDLTYTPAANYNGPDGFSFKVNDGNLDSTAASVNINVTSENDAPVANAQSVTVIYNTAKFITLTGSDAEDSALTYTVVGGPTNGTLSGTGPNLTYTPNVGSAGADFFTFRVNDGGSNSPPAAVSITTQNPGGTPAAPGALTVTVPTATKTLILNWSGTATNEDGFKIERSLSSGSGWSQIATTGINIHTFTNTGLTSNTRYYYRVRSYNRLGNSAYSNTVNARAR